MKIANLILAVMFLVFAFVQVNDPDPVLWILVYGAMAASCVLAAFGYYYPRVSVVFLTGLLLYSFTLVDGIAAWLSHGDKHLLFDDIAKMQYPYIEETREFLGLLICIIVTAVHVIRGRKVFRSA